MKTQCTSCSMPYDSYVGDFLKCFSCNQKESKKMIAHINRSKIPQNSCTTHLTLEEKKQIAAFIIETHGVLYKSYKEAPAFILKKLGFYIDSSGIRSIVNSSYFKEMAFADCE